MTGVSTFSIFCFNKMSVSLFLFQFLFLYIFNIIMLQIPLRCSDPDSSHPLTFTSNMIHTPLRNRFKIIFSFHQHLFWRQVMLKFWSGTMILGGNLVENLSWKQLGSHQGGFPTAKNWPSSSQIHRLNTSVNKLVCICKSWWLWRLFSFNFESNFLNLLKNANEKGKPFSELIHHLHYYVLRNACHIFYCLCWIKPKSAMNDVI